MKKNKPSAEKARRAKLRKKRLRLISSIPKCGLCGKTGNLTKTECCGQWICDDEDQYVMFSFARNSCLRNHSRFTLCGYHYNEEHSGDWKTCQKCRDNFSNELEMYVYYCTNEYNFEKLENLPSYKPTTCSKCGEVIILSEGGYCYGRDGYECGNCTDVDVPDFTN